MRSFWVPQFRRVFSETALVEMSFPLDEIAAVVMAPPAARKPPGKGKTPKPDLRKRKTGKKKDEDGNPDAEPKETAEVRLVETRAAPAPT